jgi:hypothetical protein
MECIQTVIFTIFRTNYCPCVLVISRKGDGCADEELRDKNKRKLVSLLVMGLLHKVKRGMSIAVIRCHYGGTEPTICFIKINEDNISRSSTICVPSSLDTYFVSTCDLFLKNTETAFYG